MRGNRLDAGAGRRVVSEGGGVHGSHGLARWVGEQEAAKSSGMARMKG